jgi:L-ascorbate metabolism protein UlaG (beta-lactamase superfamily)
MDSRQVIAAALMAGCLLTAGGDARAELATPDPGLFPAPERNAITFWGHACCYIDVDGFGIVTDPVFERTAGVRRRRVGAPPRESYGGARVVLITHAHADHLSEMTLETFPPGTIVLGPPSVAEHIGALGFEVRVMKPGEVYSYPGGRVIAVAALHGGGRWGLRAKADGRALGWVIETPYGTVFCSGDTGYFEGFAEVGNRYHPDVAVLNVNGHLRSTNAVSAALDTRARFVIPVHFGVYGWLGLGEPKNPRDYEDLERALGPVLVKLGLGKSFPLPGAAPAGDEIPREPDSVRAGGSE